MMAVVNINIDAMAVWDRCQTNLSLALNQGGRVTNHVRRLFMKEKLALLKRGLEGTDFNVDIPQLTGPTLTTNAVLASNGSPFANALQKTFSDKPKSRLGLSQWCRMASFNADPKVVLGISMPSEGQLSVQAAVLAALEHRGVNGNHAWQIIAAALSSGASAIDQNLLCYGDAVIEFDLAVELRASANGQTVLGGLTKYKQPDVEGMIRRVTEKLHRAGRSVSGRVQLDVKAMCLQMRSVSIEPETYLKIQSRRVSNASLPSTGPWHKFSGAVAATNIIMQDLFQQDTGSHEDLLRSIYPEESCLTLSDTGRAAELANNQSGRLEQGVNLYIVKGVLLVYTIYRQGSLRCDVDKLPFDNFEHVHKYTSIQRRRHGGSDVNATGCKRVRLIDWPSDHLSTGSCTIYDYDRSGDTTLFSDMKAIFGKTSEEGVAEMQCTNEDIMETFLFNLLQYDKLDSRLDDRISSKAKVFKPVFALSSDYAVVLLKQSSTLLLVANEEIGSECLEWFGKDNIVERTPSDMTVKHVPEVMTALNCSVRQGPEAEISSSKVSKLFERGKVVSLGNLVSRAENMLIEETGKQLVSWKELSARAAKMRKAVGPHGAAKGQRYLAHMLTKAGVKCHRAPDGTGACYFESLLGVKLESALASGAGSTHGCTGLLIDYGVSLQGTWTFSSPYVKDSIILKWDKVRWHNIEFIISANKFDSVQDIKYTRVGRTQSAHLRPAGNYEGEEHWTIPLPILRNLVVEGDVGESGQALPATPPLP